MPLGKTYHSTKYYNILRFLACFKKILMSLKVSIHDDIINEMSYIYLTVER